MKMNMNKEIQKYKGHIYYFDCVTHDIRPAAWIDSIDDYNHQRYELHHVVPYTDWEEVNILRESDKPLPPKYDTMPKHNALILIPKIMHQHLENPIYRLPKDKFEQVYGIHPDLILFDINSRFTRVKKLFYLEQSHPKYTKTQRHTASSDCISVGCIVESNLYQISTNSQLSLNDLNENDIKCLE